ncbi:MAG: cytochrome c oxidase subunit II transmembrane domain-containing protein [Planctomycetota bacterium]|nr:cytochrome c oxidase subunit II transmembrane domain-containing protein [Planctomycetota bacterium]
MNLTSLYTLAFDKPAAKLPAHDLWFSDHAATTAATHTDWMFMWLFWFCTAWFVVLMGLMVYFVVRYRRRPGQIAPYSPSHNTMLEVAWTVLPSLTLVFMFFEGFKGYADAAVAPGNAIEMQLKAKKWSWSLIYPNGTESPEQVTTSPAGPVKVPVFYVPEGTPIKFRMSSSDVMHSFWVPAFRVKFDVFPNRYTTYWFKATNLDTTDPATKTFSADEKVDPINVKFAGRPYIDHYIFCAEYCGDQHSEMAGIVRVVPMDVYLAKIEAWASESLEPWQIGERVYQQQCIACHSIDGKANTGPTWKDLFGHEVEFTDGTSLSAADMSDDTKFANYIRESVYMPSKKIVKGYQNQMNTFMGMVNEKQLDGVIAYMKRLSEKGQPADKK